MSYEAIYSQHGRCSACPGDKRLVCGDGPEHPNECNVMGIGEAPGAEEDFGGRPFMGRSGQELNETYLQRMGLYRGFESGCMYFTNSVKCRPENNKTPNDTLRIACASHFIADEIQMVKPKLVMLFGATASKLLGISINLERMHGIPFQVTPETAGLLGNYTGWVVCMYHPAAGLHNTAMMIPLLQDSDNIGMWLRDAWEPPHDQYQDPDYRLLESRQDLLNNLIEVADTAIDTEDRSDGELFSMQFSQAHGTGFMLLNPELWRVLIEFLNDSQVRVVGQNWPHDYSRMYDLGFRVTGYRLPDTMQLAFNLGNLPQGLKSMAVRLAGVQMHDFVDVTFPGSFAALERWFEGVQRTVEQLRPQAHVTWNKAGKPKLVPNKLPHDKILASISKAMEKAALTQDEKVFGKVRNLVSSKLVPLMYQPVPQPPRLGIEHAPLPLAIQYGCRDADLTLRVYHEMLRRAVLEFDWNKQYIVDPWRNLNLQGGSVDGKQNPQLTQPLEPLRIGGV